MQPEHMELPYRATTAHNEDACREPFDPAREAWVLLDAAGWGVREASAAARDVLGRDPRAPAGASFLDFIALHEARVALEQGMNAAVTGGQTFSPPHAVAVLPEEGAAREVSIRFRPVADAARAQVLLLLEAPPAAEAGAPLADGTMRMAHYRELAEMFGEGYLALDGGGRILFANSAAAAMLGVSAESLRDCPLTIVLPDLEEGLMERILAPGPSGVRLETVLALLDVEERPRQFECSFHRNPAGLGLTLRDITERVGRESEIAKLNATMAVSQELLRHKNNELNASLEQQEKLNRQLAKTDELKSEFLANTSHELRTPLNSIIGFLQLIDEQLCENREEELQYIHNSLNSAKNLLALINDVLDIAKIEAGKMTLLIDDHDVETILQEAYSHIYVQAQQKKLSLEIDMPEGDTLTVRADQRKTEQILINLIGNAIKFTSEGGVKVWAESEPGNADMARFSVRDTGIGVPKHMQEAIFEKFKQADGKTTRRYEGTGLGLTITRNLVEMMGGGIHLTSEGTDQGTTVWFTLPKAHPAAGDRAGLSEGNPAGETAEEMTYQLPMDF